MQNTVPFLKSDGFVASQILRNLLVVQNEERPLWTQVGSEIRQRVSQRGARPVQDGDGPEP